MFSGAVQIASTSPAWASATARSIARNAPSPACADSSPKGRSASIPPMSMQAIAPSGTASAGRSTATTSTSTPSTEAARRRRSASPTTTASGNGSSPVSAPTMISGPIPAASPIVMAIGMRTAP